MSARYVQPGRSSLGSAVLSEGSGDERRPEAAGFHVCSTTDARVQSGACGNVTTGTGAALGRWKEGQRATQVRRSTLAFLEFPGRTPACWRRFTGSMSTPERIRPSCIYRLRLGTPLIESGSCPSTSDGAAHITAFGGIELFPQVGERIREEVLGEEAPSLSTPMDQTKLVHIQIPRSRSAFERGLPCLAEVFSIIIRLCGCSTDASFGFLIGHQLCRGSVLPALFRHE